MSALLTDLYQLTMMQAHLNEGLTDQAVFELFVRKLPLQRNFLVAAGLEHALQFLKSLSFSEAEYAWLRDHGEFSERMLEYVKALRFTGDVDAMPEGTVFFAGEPILRITAPLPLAQLVGSRLLNIVHFETLIASKAARAVIAAGERRLVDFGMRRAHGADAALRAARAAYLVGFDGTATADAGRRFGVPVFGTVAHSHVQAHGSGKAAFLAFAQGQPEGATVLIDTYDTYDTEAAAAKLIELSATLGRQGLKVVAMRLDNGDLHTLATAVRGMLDAANLHDITIFASGNLDELRIAELLRTGTPLDGFCLGASLDASSDAPLLDAAYELQRYAGAPRRRRSQGGATWPGVKQVLRQLDAQGHIERDLVVLESEQADGQALLLPCMRAGRRVGRTPTLNESRAHHAHQMSMLPPTLRALEPAEAPFSASFSPGVVALAREAGAFDA